MHVENVWHASPDPDQPAAARLRRVAPEAGYPLAERLSDSISSAWLAQVPDPEPHGSPPAVTKVSGHRRRTRKDSFHRNACMIGAPLRNALRCSGSCLTRFAAISLPPFTPTCRSHRPVPRSNSPFTASLTSAVAFKAPPILRPRPQAFSKGAGRCPANARA